MTMNKAVCVIVGFGPGNGAAFAERFAKAGYTLALLSRTTTLSKPFADKLKNAYAYECDVSNHQDIEKTFNQIQHDLGNIDVVIYNAGSGQWGSVDEITLADFESNWRVNTFGLLCVSQHVIPAMKQRKQGKIIIIGATASKRGAIKTAAFAPAKAAQRSLAESMAKYLWPYGVHVALIIIDGIIDLPKTRERMPDKPDDFFIKPHDIAETVYWVAHQPSSAWSFEIEVRPYGEKW